MSDNKIVFTDYSEDCKEAIRSAAVAWLEEASNEVVSQIRRLSAVKTGKTKGSYSQQVDDENLVAYVGSNEQNAIWEEYGTGIHAVNGDGRRDVPWKYQDSEGQWHSTCGKAARQPMKKAFDKSRDRIVNRAKSVFGGIR